jgi:hypothetical protein
MMNQLRLSWIICAKRKLIPFLPAQHPVLLINKVSKLSQMALSFDKKPLAELQY